MSFAKEGFNQTRSNYAKGILDMKWLITGGWGFIGRNLIQYPLNDGSHQIRVLDNLSSGTSEDLSQICRFERFYLQIP